MNAIIRRLRRLEERLGPAVETEFDRQLLARIEAGRRRVAEAQAQELSPGEHALMPDSQRRRLLEGARFGPASNRGR